MYEAKESYKVLCDESKYVCVKILSLNAIAGAICQQQQNKVSQCKIMEGQQKQNKRKSTPNKIRGNNDIRIWMILQEYDDTSAPEDNIKQIDTIIKQNKLTTSALIDKWKKITYNKHVICTQMVNTCNNRNTKLYPKQMNMPLWKK